MTLKRGLYGAPPVRPARRLGGRPPKRDSSLVPEKAQVANTPRRRPFSGPTAGRWVRYLLGSSLGWVVGAQQAPTTWQPEPEAGLGRGGYQNCPTV